MQLDYTNFPPISYFKLVLQHMPRSALIYASLWDHRLKGNKRCAYAKDKIKNLFLLSSTLFRNHLIDLSRLGILTFEETPKFFLVHFCESGSGAP